MQEDGSHTLGELSDPVNAKDDSFFFSSPFLSQDGSISEQVENTFDMACKTSRSFPQVWH